MSEKRYFVVRESGIRFSVEHGKFRTTDHQRRKRHEHGARIEYECEIPETMTLREAIRLYSSGVRVKAPPAPVADRKVLADVLREKREGRARAKAVAMPASVRRSTVQTSSKRR